MKTNSLRYISPVLIFFFLVIFSSNIQADSKIESEHKKDYSLIAIDTLTDRVFAVKKEKGIDVIDINTGQKINTIPLNKEIEAIVIDEQRRILLAAEEKTIRIISLDTYQLLSGIKTKHESEILAIDAGLGLLLVLDEEDRLTTIDLNTYQKAKEIKLSKKPVSIAIDSGLHLAVIAHHTWGEEKNNESMNRDDDDERHKDRDNITIIDLNTLSAIKTLQAGKRPSYITVNPVTHEAAISDEKSNDLTIIDLNTQTIKGTIPVGKHPEALSYNKCLNTLSVIGGEDKAWMQVIDMDTWNKKASYHFKDELKDIKIHSYLNKAVISGEHKLNIISLPNPLPKLISIIPEKAERGGKAFNLTINGKGLLKTTEIYINGSRADSTFLQCNLTEAQIPGDYLNNAGDIEIKAANPSPEGGISNPLYLKVENPVPQISSIVPLETKTNAGNLTLSIYGTGFFPDTEIYFNNLIKPITYISPIKLQIDLTSEDLKTAGEYEIIARNLSPGGGTSNKVIFTIKPSLEITITSPQDGETINKAKTIVKGTFKSDSNDIGIKVNGVIAEITGNEWAVNNIPLSTGTNIIEATATDAYENTDTKTITINTTDATQHVTLSANITSGIAPLQVYFTASTETPNPISSYKMDFDGDGIIDYTGTTFENITYTYTQEGIFYPKLTVMDEQNNTYSDTIAITILNKAEIDTLLKEKWEGMKGEMINKNVEKTIRYFAESSKDMFRYNFELMKEHLPTIASDMSNITIKRLDGNLAEYEMFVTQDGIENAFYIEFIRDVDGIWRINFF